jgi:hypothetical protein
LSALRCQHGQSKSCIYGGIIINWFRRVFIGDPVPSSRNKVIEAEGIARDRGDIPAHEKAKELDRMESDTHEDPDSPQERQRDFRAAAQWRVAKALLVLRDQVNQIAPNRDKSSDGTIGDDRHCAGGGTSDHCQNVHDGNVGVVTVIDITHDKRHGCDAEVIAESIRGSRDPRVKYIIWNRRIANSSPIGEELAWAWRPYSGQNPHTQHVHISVKPTKEGPGGYDTTTAWTISGAIA